MVVYLYLILVNIMYFLNYSKYVTIVIKKINLVFSLQYLDQSLLFDIKDFSSNTILCEKTIKVSINQN